MRVGEWLLLFKFRLIMFDGAAEMFFMLLVDTNIIVVKIDQRSLLICGKKVVFPVIVDPLERFNWVIVKRWWT